MLRTIFGPKSPQAGVTVPVVHDDKQITFSDAGIDLPLFNQIDLKQLYGEHRIRAAYLLQLVEDGYLNCADRPGLLEWDTAYALLSDPDHAEGMALLALPEEFLVVPVLASQGGLSDPTFTVFIREWRTPAGDIVSSRLQREGAVFILSGMRYRMAPGIWHLLQEIRDFETTKKGMPGEATNRSGWAKIRRAAKLAGARFDGFLERTVVVEPDSLRLKLTKSEHHDMHVLEVTPYFDDQPAGWLDAFDRMQNVRDHYAIPSASGGVTHVLISPEVKTVLQEIRSMPGRRVAGDRALQLLRNPYSCLGNDANQVLNHEQFEADREEAGFTFFRFTLHPIISEAHRILSIYLHLDAMCGNAQAEVMTFATPADFRPFVDELRFKLASRLPCGFWRGHELDLADFDEEQFNGIEAFSKRWENECTGLEFEQYLDLSSYGQRVLGIGVAVKPVSPYLMNSSGQQWLPAETLDAIGLDGALLAQWDTDNPALLAEFEQNIVDAMATQQATVTIPGLEAAIPIGTARVVAAAWAAKLRKSPSGAAPAERAERSVLNIEHNVDAAAYVESRSASLRLQPNATFKSPAALLPDAVLREHQKVGVAWLQHLFACSPALVSGCLLADDMGLGKTLQLLTFIAGYLEQSDVDEPVMIVAPVSLLENWEGEINRFFVPGFGPLLKLYGSGLAPLRIAKENLPASVTGRGIFNLMVPGWLGNARIVLTTYETLRDQEFSLARQRWSIVICDEAQKIKNPAALVTQAAKAIPARFKVACTGTPVENSLTDLWCLFDFIQPGYLGSLNEFGKRYRRPEEAPSDERSPNMDELKALIDPQILRRMKADVAKDLPRKIELPHCKELRMSADQRLMYLAAIDNYQKRDDLINKFGGTNMAILGLLHTMKMICAHPVSLASTPHQVLESPKMHWLLDELETIRQRDEKVIIFTELRDIQLALRLAILDRFNLHVRVINGDTKVTGKTGLSRQGIIDDFQSKPGFGVIVLSTTAVGFGVNVQAANHVIHFTRCWNPAKEDQATDRAYRIGQTKDVFVYYPTVTTHGLDTFEVKLDSLLHEKRMRARDIFDGAGDIDLMKFANASSVGTTGGT